MSSLRRQLVLLVLQFLDEEEFKETVHKLEQESGCFFNMKYFEDQIQGGEWEEVERYLSGFTKVDENRYSLKIFFEIRKQKYLEALDKQDRAKAVDILVKDLKVFSSFHEELYKEITQLLTLANFRENEQLTKYGDTQSERNILLIELKKLIEANPLFRDKLTFPALKVSRLRTLINQSLNWQHHLCRNPRPNPTMKTLFIDHTCYYQSADSEHVMTPPTPGGPAVEDMKTQVYNHTGGGGSPSHPENTYTSDSLPKNVARTLNQGAYVTSMDFHPIQQTILLVGTNVGDIGIWEVGSRERLAQRIFKVWDLSCCSMPMQAALVKDPAVSVNRTVWSPDGRLLGVAFSKYIVHIYSYSGGNDLRQHLEIDAHVGGVNDLAFSHPNKQFCVITCGDDKTIKVWDAVTGHKQYTFEGHEAPVYSVCPHHEESIQFMFSTAVDGKVKAWLYDFLGSRVDYDAPGHGCTTMAYNADGTRLFSCGTSKEGESYLVEWDESEGAIKRTYSGFHKRSLGVVQFDTTRNRFLAAGDEFLIKFWDMDSTILLTTIEADGGLPNSPRLRFNKEGSLLAVTTADYGMKILANTDGMGLLRASESRACDNQRGPPQPTVSKPPGVDAMTVFSATIASGPSAGVPDQPDAAAAAVSLPGPVMDDAMTEFSATISSGPSAGVPDRPDGNTAAVSMPRLVMDDAMTVFSAAIGSGPSAGVPDRPDRNIAAASVPGPVMDGPSLIAGQTRPRDKGGNDHLQNEVDNSRPQQEQKPNVQEDLAERVKIWKLTEIADPNQCRSARLPNTIPASKISGVALPTLCSSAVHKLWKWAWNERNVSGEATASFSSEFWQHPRGMFLTNDINNTNTNPEEAVPCIPLSKNDSYVIV